jgi:hypothetical protein
VIIPRHALRKSAKRVFDLLVAGIHVLDNMTKEDMDGRVRREDALRAFARP